MKKNSSLRLKLHCETLRALTGPETEEAQGGVTLATCTSIVITACGCPTHNNCPTFVQNCTALC